jgi:hypothetical protein
MDAVKAGVPIDDINDVGLQAGLYSNAHVSDDPNRDFVRLVRDCMATNDVPLITGIINDLK